MIYLQKFKVYLTNREIIIRVFVTLLILFIYRILSKVPAPGIEQDALKSLFGGQNQSGLFNIANILAGGTLNQFSIISIGLFAYISASVIFQLLGSVVPKIEQLQKMGETGRRVIDQWTRLLTVPLAAIQSLALYFALKSANNIAGRPLVDELSIFRIVTLVLVLTAGTMLLIWLAEICSENGLGGKRGGGVSLIITAGIIASLPTSLVNAFSSFIGSDYLRNFWIAFGSEWVLFGIIFFIFVLLISFANFILKLKNHKLKFIYTVLYTIILIAIVTAIDLVIRNEFEITKQIRILIDTNVARLDTVETRFGFFLALTIQIIGLTVFFNESYRKIPIKFIARIRTYPDKSLSDMSYLPIKLLGVGVMPVIFASSLLFTPEVIYRFFGEQIKEWNGTIGRVLEYASQGWLNQMTSPYYHILHFILTVLFSLFFITIILKPEDVANDLKAKKTFIPGVRPGQETVDFLYNVIIRVTFWGGLVIATISALPYLFGLYNSTVPLGIESLIAGGTSILIVVPTVLAVKNQLDALVLTKNYEKFEEI